METNGYTFKEGDTIVLERLYDEESKWFDIRPINPNDINDYTNGDGRVSRLQHTLTAKEAERINKTYHYGTTCAVLTKKGLRLKSF